jgi:hypothetical protein
MENTIADLPSKEFFLKNLDAPGRLDEKGNVLPLVRDPAPERQVKSKPATTIASKTTP